MILVRCRRPLAALLLAWVWLSAAPTRADSGGPLALERRFDVPVAHAIDMFFDAADTEQITMRGFAHVRHIVNVFSLRVWATPRLALRLGAGPAGLVDSPVASAAKMNGSAMVGSLYFAVLQPRGLSLGVELSTLQVHYENAPGLREGTVLLALSSR